MTKNTKIGSYVLLQITSVVDQIFGTNYSSLYGANVDLLEASSDYRDQLPYIFTLSYLNPFFGQGRKFRFIDEINGVLIKSIDNYYVAEYIRYAYPGLISFILFTFYTTIVICKYGFKKESALCKCLGVGCICYLSMLYTVESLATLKFLYLLFALCVVWIEKNQMEDVDSKKSIYIKMSKEYN